MIEIVNKENCTGCTACQQICPKRCILMREDEEGFCYPVVNRNMCISCGKCEKICPVLNTKFVAKSGYPDAYLVYDVNENWRKKSAAGGGFVALARFFIEKYHGVVFGAVYDKDYHVYHEQIDQADQLFRVQKSKYVQSDVRDTFLQVRRLLEIDKYVLYSGTPCQIYGLKAFLGKLAVSDKLYCVDLSCHGVPSPKVLKKYLEALELKECSKIKSFTMRDKKFKRVAYEQGFGVVFQNGNSLFIPHSQDMFGRCFWGEMVSRPSCYNCHFKTIWRDADITLGDCWFMSCFVPAEDDDLGVTMALAHTDKGKLIIEQNDKLVWYNVKAEDLIKANGGMIYSSAKANPQRADFFKKLDSVPFEILVDNFLPAKQMGTKHKILKLLDCFGIRMESIRKQSRERRLCARLKSEIPECAKGELK